MKKTMLVFRGIVFIALMFFTACEDVSSNQRPPLTANSSPEPTGETTPIPGQTLGPTAVPELTDEPMLTESQGLTEEPTVSPEPTGGPAVTPEETQGPVVTQSPSVFPDRLMISEIMYNPRSPDSDWEWIEVYNGTPDEIDAAGWVVDDGNKTPHSCANIASGIIPAHGTGVLFNSDVITSVEFETAWGEGINLIPVSDWGTMGLNNSGDRIGIWESFSAYDGDHETFINVVCMIEYIDITPWPADDGAGSIYVSDLAADASDGAHWALSTAGDTTPLGTCSQSRETGTNSGADIGSP